jgi:hypothetical protein
MNLEVMKIMPIIHMDYTNEVYIKKKFKFMSSCIFFILLSHMSKI